ncbi:MAG TPA: proton-conducting transporter membrane subunit [Gemmatimonadales bacterium]|nr:proton-conducting transporter membrane subunit [Gemmatimonadales bacterium]
MTLFFAGLLLLVLAGAAPLALARRAAAASLVFRGLLVPGGAAVSWAAVRVLSGGPTVEIRLSPAVPGGAWVFGIDPLTAWFLVLIAVVGVASAWYGFRYLAQADGHRPAGFLHLLITLEIVFLALVVTARAAIPFLIAWEIMAVLAYFLVIHQHDREDVRRAGLIYLVSTHAGTLALIALFAFWGRDAGTLTFDALAAAAPALPAGGALIFALALLGFGVKAGLVPLHFWLPGAHAAGPTPVSALMSGVLIKMGIYGLLRIVSLAGPPPAWWGWLILCAGLGSGVLGVLWALTQHDLKRLLAYHSVENIGIILIGLGIGALGARFGAPVIAAVGFAGAVAHTLNHALFKSLLFLGAGAVQRATGTRVMDRLGGLARPMPLTWTAFVIGSAAIVGLPPLNGFVSEWLVYQGLLRSAEVVPARAGLFGVAGLALIGALALACFAKVGGAVFLGHPRSDPARAAREVDAGLLGPMFALALACLAIGVVPVLAVIPALRIGAAIGGIGGEAAAAAAVTPALRWISVIAVALVVLTAAGWWVRGRTLARRPRGRTATWGCGYARPEPRMQYTAASFAAPLVTAYGLVAGMEVVRRSGHFHTHPREIVLDHLAVPLWTRVRSVAVRFRPIQHGRLWAYLLYLLGTLIALLLYLALRAGGAPA